MVSVDIVINTFHHGLTPNIVTTLGTSYHFMLMSASFGATNIHFAL